MSAPIEVHLSSGVLTLTLSQETLPLEELCTFATRQNPNRAFLFVSKVLGKHVPVTLKKARWAYQQLVEKIPANLTGTVAWVGMAETATGFAEELAWNWANYYGRRDGWLQMTTRYPLANVPYSHFEEIHSHATFQAIHLPETMRSDIRTLVLVDDEITTGNTMFQLMKTYQHHCTHLHRVLWVVLKSWMTPALEKNYVEQAAQSGIHLEVITLLKGTYSFTIHPDFKVSWPENTLSASVNTDNSFNRPALGMDRLRAGLCVQPERPVPEIISLPASEIASLQSSGTSAVVGFGECNAPAFLLAEQLEQWGIASTVQSITRSPILEGDTIYHKHHWPDPYGSKVPHYSYNLDPQKIRGLHVISECSRIPLPEPWKHAWLWHWNGYQLIRTQ